jgi:hypothetical protein
MSQFQNVPSDLISALGAMIYILKACYSSGLNLSPALNSGPIERFETGSI